MLNKNTCKCLKQRITCFDITNMRRAIVFNYFESGAQASYI